MGNRYDELSPESQSAFDSAINSTASGNRVEITIRNPYKADDVVESYVFDLDTLVEDAARIRADEHARVSDEHARMIDQKEEK